MSNLPASLTFDWSQRSDNLPADAMDRAKHAQFLTSLLVRKAQTGCYVLNLNAGWGAGKTWFLRRWQNELKDVYPTVYIDAWKNDYLQDPLLNVVAEIRTSLINLTDKEALNSKVMKGTWRLFKAIAPEVTKTLLKNRFGMDWDELGKILSSDDSAEIGAKLVESALEAHDEAGKSIEEFRDAINSWLSAVINCSEPKLCNPLFIFIDELDRCRPTFAIEMLETVKHIFDIENVVFVISTDKDQLEHSIRAVYGTGFDSRLYLDRFFNRSVTLNNVSCKQYITERLKASSYFEEYTEKEENFQLERVLGTRKEEVCELLSKLADSLNMRLRTVDLWLDRLEAALISAQRRPFLPLLAFLMALETHDPTRFQLLVNNKNIFGSPSHRDDNHITMSSFKIILKWKFRNITSIVELQNSHSHLDTIRSSNVDFISFIKNIMQKIQVNDADNLFATSAQSIQDIYISALRGQEPEAGELAGRLDHYHFCISDILAAYHGHHKMTLNYYLDLCRFAMHLN